MLAPTTRLPWDAIRRVPAKALAVDMVAAEAWESVRAFLDGKDWTARWLRLLPRPSPKLIL
eukprot:3534785-Rhodomonas_salina.1